MKVKVKPYSLVLHDRMSRGEIIEALEKLIFTASHDWERRVIIDRNVRDMIVRGLHQSPTSAMQSER